MSTCLSNFKINIDYVFKDRVTFPIMIAEMEKYTNYRIVIYPFEEHFLKIVVEKIQGTTLVILS